MRITALVLVLIAGCAEEDNPRYPTPGPIGPQPTNTPIVAAAGGTACIGQSTLCVFIPAGALSEDATVTIRQASGMPTPAAILAASAYDIRFTPDTATFSGSATLTYQLPSVSLTGRTLGIAYADVDAWAFDGISNLAHTTGATLDVVSANTNHFTAFAVVDLDVLAGCLCDIDNTCTDGCACDPDCCQCDVDNTCTSTCACDPDCMVTTEPDIAVAYGGYEGPATTDCVSGVCAIPAGNALDLGTVAPLSSTTAQLTIVNRAACAGGCEACMITIAPNSVFQNIGFGFSANQGGAFSFIGSAPTTFEIRQESVSCSEPGVVNVLVSFTAPAMPGSYAGVIVIESNDPDEMVIDVPVVATSSAGAVPVAIADYRACPGTPCTDPMDVQPGERVYLDGSGSYDTDGTVMSYLWEVISFPASVNVGELLPAGGTTEYFDFLAPAAGVYEVLLTVWDDDGLESADNANARVVVVAMSDSDVRIVLEWDTDADLDLHLTYVDSADLLCQHTYDCYYSNKTPVWFGNDAAGTGANPRMDIDDDAFGPENIFIDTADDGTFRIYVHYWDNTGSATIATLSVTVPSGTTTFTRSLLPNDVWAVADVIVGGGGLVIIAQEYPGDPGGDGAVASMGSSSNCIDSGWDFP